MSTPPSRNLLITSLFVLGGFVCGWATHAVVQPPASKSAIASGAAASADTISAKDTPSGFAPSSGSGPLASAGSSTPSGEELQAEVETPEKKMAKITMQKLIEGLESGDRTNPRVMLGRIQQLMDLGPDGLQVIADFFATGEDFVLDQNGGFGRWGGPSTLRTALLRALSDSKAPEALAISQSVIQSSPYAEEIALAHQNLNRAYPGQYDAIAVTQMQAVLNGLKGRTDMTADELSREYRHATQLAQRTGATQLLPMIESSVIQDPSTASRYAYGLSGMPAAEQAASLQRLSSNPEVAKQLASNTRALAGFDLSNSAVAGQVSSLYNTQMNQETQESFLRSVDGSRSLRYRDPAQGGAPLDEQLTRLNGTLGFLNTLAPSATTPVLQQEHNDAVRFVQGQIQQVVQASQAPTAANP